MTTIQFSKPARPDHNLSFINGRWVLRYLRDGKNVRKSLATTDIETARDLRDAFIYMLKQDPSMEVVEPPDGTTGKPRGRRKVLPPGRTEPLPQGIAWRKPWVAGGRAFRTLEEAQKHLQKP